MDVVVVVLVGLHGYLCWLKLGDDRDREGELWLSGESQKQRTERNTDHQLNIIY